MNSQEALAHHDECMAHARDATDDASKGAWGASAMRWQAIADREARREQGVKIVHDFHMARAGLSRGGSRLSREESQEVTVAALTIIGFVGIVSSIACAALGLLGEASVTIAVVGGVSLLLGAAIAIGGRKRRGQGTT